MSRMCKKAIFGIFPEGLPHPLQRLGPDGCEFLICFAEGKS
jgi:oxalate decarboxylase